MGRITGLLLLLWAGATVSTVLDLQKRIIGGQPCIDSPRLYHVKLTDQNNKLVCGGSLVSNQWILTAEHCLKPGRVLEAVVHPYGGTPLEITKAVPFKVKDAKGTVWKHDIMLLKLTKPVTGITPVALPDCKDRPKLNDVVQIAGHGDNTRRPGEKHIYNEIRELLCADADVVDCAPYMDCMIQANPPPYAHPLDQHMVCAERDGVDISYGDSGGGVVKKGIIYGVHVESDEYVCGRAIVYVDVCEHKKWINEIVPGLNWK